jgi:23S rRNA G2445 N2-methylase RlmL
VKNALVEGAARRGIRLELDPEKPQVIFHARSLETRQGPMLSVGIDLAGRPMHQRGYRLVSGEAPLREDLAAQLLMLARFDPRSDVLIDPMAGSGTLAIEAALMAAGKPIWMSGRSPLARELEPFHATWSTKEPALFADAQPAIYAGELDPDTYAILDRSLATAGTSPQTSTFLGDFRDWDLCSHIATRHGETQKALIVSNPPYGARLGAPRHELRDLYRDLARWCRQFRGARAAFLIGDPDSGNDRFSEADRRTNSIALFMDAFGQAPRIKKPMKNGQLNALFLLYDF